MYDNLYRCNNCHSHLHYGMGGYMYVTDEQGKRIVCPHLVEVFTVMNVLGNPLGLLWKLSLMTGVFLQWRHKTDFPGKININLPALVKKAGFNDSLVNAIQYIRSRVGFNSDCLCLDCLETFKLDLGSEEWKNCWRNYYKAFSQRDERRCPFCKSTEVKTVLEMVGSPCPDCKVGTTEENITGGYSNLAQEPPPHYFTRKLHR